MAPKNPKGGAGRKRIDTKSLIEDPASRQVAFSKRRFTLFNMASDLSALSGVDTAIVTFSSSTRGTAYAFGSPSVDTVLRRVPTGEDAVVEEEEEEAACESKTKEEEAARVAAMRQDVEDTKTHVEAEKARIKTVEKGVKRSMDAARTTLWWQADVNALGAAELPDYEAALRRFKEVVQRQVDAAASTGWMQTILSSYPAASGHANGVDPCNIDRSIS